MCVRSIYDDPFLLSYSAYNRQAPLDRSFHGGAWVLLWLIEEVWRGGRRRLFYIIMTQRRVGSLQIIVDSICTNHHYLGGSMLY